MAKRLDRILVIDVEATCWQEAPPFGQESEIIEIGIASLDVATMQVISKEQIFVKPEKSAVSRFCEVLTGITQEILDSKGAAFWQACKTLRESHASRSRTWASYGDYDRMIFQQQCQSRGVEYPFGSTHINVKNLFALARGLSHEVSMPQALQIAGLELEGTHHRGVDDAYNTAKLLAQLLRGE
ncbi:MAG TPA: 3'-5' exonuclease [Blastocatellia bacterium]|nr:3'-5' exonuclease [Blastocatellia bacterium]